MSRDPRVGYARPLRGALMDRVGRRRRSLPTQTAHAGIGPSPKAQERTRRLRAAFGLPEERTA